MKAACLMVLAIAFTHLTALAQNRVAFANTSTTLITTNGPFPPGGNGNISGAGNYRFGLYVGDVGTGAGALTLVGLGTNTALAGRFSGGGEFILPAPWGDGRALNFVVRGWSAFAGMTYEEAVSKGPWGGPNNDQCIYTGGSGFGTVTPTASPNPAAALFGTGAGQIGGFALMPQCVPEPSTWALASMAAGAALCFTRRRTSR
jgi:hypothetical protein